MKYSTIATTRRRFNRTNEYYTTMETVELHFRLIDKLIKKHNIDTFVLPCDSENSNYVKYLSNKECKLIYFQDMYNLEYYPKIDKSKFLVITNPPFAGLTKWERWLIDNDFNFSILSGSSKCNDRTDYFDTYLGNIGYTTPDNIICFQAIFITNNKGFGESDPYIFRDYDICDKRIEKGKKAYQGIVQGHNYYNSLNGIYVEPIGSEIWLPFNASLIMLRQLGYIDFDSKRTDVRKYPEFKNTFERRLCKILKHKLD